MPPDGGRASSAGERLADGRCAGCGVAGGGDGEAERLDHRGRRDDEQEIRGGGRVRKRRRVGERGEPLHNVLLVVEPGRVALVDVPELGAPYQQRHQRHREQHHEAEAPWDGAGEPVRA